MKKSKYPRLRSHTRKGKSGQVWTWWTYDMRPDGGTEISLGSDYAQALEKWHKLHHHIPMVKGTIQEAIDKWRAECLPAYREKTREEYTRHLARIEPVFGKAAWHEVTVPGMRAYLDKRTAKTQGNRELSVLSILWGMARRWGMTQLEWPARDLKGWKNPEKPRAFEVTDEMFAAVHHEADQVLKDCMDLASATGMRLTDVRTIAMPWMGCCGSGQVKPARALISLSTSRPCCRHWWSVAKSAMCHAPCSSSCRPAAPCLSACYVSGTTPHARKPPSRPRNRITQVWLNRSGPCICATCEGLPQTSPGIARRHRSCFSTHPRHSLKSTTVPRARSSRLYGNAQLWRCYGKRN